MALDPSYLVYARRRHGMDHDRYGWSSIFDRPSFLWLGGKRLALWVVVDLEWFPIAPNDAPFRAPGHMQTYYPDYRHYTAREYGTRVGVYRLLDALSRAGIRASFAMNSAIAERYPELARTIDAEGHEIIAHGRTMNDVIATGGAEGAEREIISQSLDSIQNVCGVRPRGWASVARSQSWDTLSHLAEAGIVYQCDWPNDDLPYWQQSERGAIGNMPLNHELSDRQILIVQQQSTQSYVQQISDAADFLSAEAQTHGARMLGLQLTPYIAALPYRIDLVDVMLRDLAARENVWAATGAEIFGAWAEANKRD